MADIPEQIIVQPITEEMADSYLTYSMSVIMARALPDVRDGLKPSQRRILVAMNDLNLGPRAQHRKCAKIAGDTSGNYHPHGEQVIYPTLVRLGQPWNMRYMLVDGQGNFGSVDGDPPAAMRYTEARMTSASIEMLQDLELETVDFEPNYDETREEPTVLPSKFPNLMVNGSTGIAVGMATNMPPHNLREVVDGLLRLIDEPEVTVDELMEVIPGPDFPTGGIICGRLGIRDAYRTGRGAVVIRGRLLVDEGKNGKRRIVITEIPYMVLRSTIVEKIAECIKEGTIKDASDVIDASDRRNPIRIEVELRKDANEDVVINQLYQYTPLQSAFHVANVALVGRQPRTLNLKQLLEQYLLHRREVIRRRTSYLLRKARQRAHILEGLILAVSDIDALIELIKRSPDPKTARAALMARPLRLIEQETLQRLLPEAFLNRMRGTDQFMTHVQADAILAMQLQRLTGLEIEKLGGDYARLIEEIEGYELILRDEKRVLDIIREDLQEMRDKYGDARRTEIAEAAGEFSIEELIPDENVIVTISRQGYIKRIELDTYRRQGRGGRGVRGSEIREGDYLQYLFTASTHDYLLFFTTRGRVYWLKVYDVPAMSRTSRGRSIANLVSFQSNEALRAVLPVRKFEENYLFFATTKGVVKKTPLAAYANPRNSGIIAITLDPDDELINVEQTSGNDQVVLGSREGMAIRFEEKDVRAMGRSARGVRGMELDGDDRVVDMCVIYPGDSLLTVCQNGYGKRTSIDEYRLIRRGGKGVINIKTTERNGQVVALKAVQDQDELMMITAQGILLRTGLEAVREIGRATQGVKMIRIDEGDQLVAVTRIAREDDEPIEELSDAPGTKQVEDKIPDPSESQNNAADDVTDGDENTPA
ncbi:MAG: DNA gyrase subunit A [Phycisphaerae bacterium]|nr:DNA gyrase subunit A [Phycisphaerae bacterium]